MRDGENWNKEHRWNRENEEEYDPTNPSADTNETEEDRRISDM